MGAHACDPSALGGRGGKIGGAQEFETSLKPKTKNLTQAWEWEAKAGGWRHRTGRDACQPRDLKSLPTLPFVRSPAVSNRQKHACARRCVPRTPTEARMRAPPYAHLCVRELSRQKHACAHCCAGISNR